MVDINERVSALEKDVPVQLPGSITWPSEPS